MGSLLAAVGVASIVFGLAFGKFPIFFGIGLLILGLGLVARERSAERRMRRALADEPDQPRRRHVAMSPPALPTLLWHAWAPTWSLDVEAVLAGLLYLLAVRRTRSRWPARRTAAFLAGIACVLVALQSGIDAYGDRMLSVHMVQHLLLLELAPLLVLAGRPGLLLLRAAPRSARPVLVRGLERLRPLTHPIACLAVFGVVVAATHLPGFYDATLRSPALHDAEHVLYLLAGLLMWWPLLDPDPLARHRLDGFARLVYVIAAMAADDAPRGLPGPRCVAALRRLCPPRARAGHLGGIRPAAGGGDHVGAGLDAHDPRRAVAGDGRDGPGRATAGGPGAPG